MAMMSTSIQLPTGHSYAHQNYVQDDAPTSPTTQLQVLIAARIVTKILDEHLSLNIRWAYRGFLAYRCHNTNVTRYPRYTDDIDIAVDSKSFETIDEIENTLLQVDPKHFQRCLSPSKLWKVHFVTPNSRTRLDIYNTTMHNIGDGFYHNFELHRMKQPHQFAECPAFDMPVLSATALVDLKLVAFLERQHAKDLRDVFFMMMEVKLDAVAGFPFLRREHVKYEVSLHNLLESLKEGYMVEKGLEKASGVLEQNLELIFNQTANIESS